MAAIAWPTTLLTLSSVIDNPYSCVLARSAHCGRYLAETLLNREHGKRPVSIRLVEILISRILPENFLQATILLVHFPLTFRLSPGHLDRLLTRRPSDLLLPARTGAEGELGGHHSGCDHARCSGEWKSHSLEQVLEGRQRPHRERLLPRRLAAQVPVPNDERLDQDRRTGRDRLEGPPNGECGSK